jgi:hypothetical protein
MIEIPYNPIRNWAKDMNHFIKEDTQMTNKHVKSFSLSFYYENAKFKSQ